MSTLPTPGENPWLKTPIQWPVLGWFIGVHVAGVLGCVYFGLHPDLRTFLVHASVWLLCQLSISVCIHRYYAHGSYEATPGWCLFWLIWFAASLQSYAKWWAAIHRRHHAYSDTGYDPYSVLVNLRW